MRITGGFLGGRNIVVPKTGLRPTQDRIRAAVFSSLSAMVVDAVVLDIFAGTGAMGLEAFSRGAAFVCWVEKDFKTFRVLRENIVRLCGSADSGRRVLCSDAIKFLARPERDEERSSFDIVFADPPYDNDGAWLKKILSLLSETSILKTGGLLVMEQESSAPVVFDECWSMERNKAYGGTRVCFFRKLKP